MPNPYEAPKVSDDGGAPLNVSVEDCPRCQSQEIHKPSFTWWGGALGPKLLSHRVCRKCGFGFNSKTRQSNTTAIVVYSVIVCTIAGAIAFALAWR
jgi:hypothetical protein